jgi:MFS family permease
MPPKEVAIYRNYANIVNMVGRSLGAPIGGFLAQTVGWRWYECLIIVRSGSNYLSRSFFAQVPLIAGSLFIAAHQMPASLNNTDQAEGSTRSKIKRIDFAGIVMFATSVLLLLFVVDNIEPGALQQTQTFYILLGAICFSVALFLLYEAYWTDDPLIPLKMLKTSFGAYCLSQFLITISSSAVRTRTENPWPLLISSFSLSQRQRPILFGYMTRANLEQRW